MKVKTEKRIGEIEESLRLLAKYMKEESARLEKKTGKTDLSHVEEEIEEIKKQLEERHGVHEESPVATDIENKLQSEVARLEGLIYSIPKEKLLKDYAENMKIGEELKKSVDLRLQVIESKIKNTAQDIVSSKLQDFQILQERFKRLDERVSNAVSILESMKASRSDDDMRKLEKRMKERLDELEEQLKKDDRHDDREYRKLLAEMEELREQMKKDDRHDDKEYRKLLAEMEELREQMKKDDRHDDRELKKFYDEMTEFKEEVGNRLKHFQRKEDLTRMLNEIKGRFEEYDAKMRKLDNKDYASRHDFEKLQKELEDSRKAIVKDDIEINNIRKTIESEIKAVASKFSVPNVKDDIMTLSQRLAEMESTLDKRLVAVENYEGRSADEQDLLDLRSDIDDVDKRLVETEMNIKDLKKLELQTKKALEHVENFDRDMKIESTKFVTAHLAEFAKHVDRKLPAVVTRDEFSRSMIELNHRISTVEAPDMTRFNRRMQALESKLNDIYSMLRAFGSSIPVVVE